MSLYTLGSVGGEAQIVDRVSKYQQLPDDQLREIITQYGGEMGEAAKRVLASRGSAAVAPITIPTGAVTVKIPAALAPKIDLMSFSPGNPLVLAGIAAAAVVLGLMFTGKKARA